MFKKTGKRMISIILSAAMACSIMLTGCGGGYSSLPKHAIEAGETPDVNPLKGFFPYAGEVLDFPISLEWFYIPVNAVHLDRGVYDWSALEFRLNEVAKRGHQAVMRFYYDCPGDVVGIPQYLLDEGLLVRQYNEPDSLGGGGLCPDYSDELFRESMQEFIAEFGKEYDGDPRIAFITEGLLGFWGEWHNWPFDIDLSDQKPDWTVPAEVYEEVYQAFDDAFDKTHLLVREPKDGVDNAKYKTGYHDDSFAYATLSFDNGGQEWSYMSRMKNHETQDAWEYAPIGGEVYPPLQDYYFMEEYYKTEPAPTDPTADMAIRQNWDACVEESHASFMLVNGIINYADATRENALDASKSLGYDMQVTNAYFADSMESSDSLKLMVDIKNNGIAPFYYDHETWPTLIGIKQNGTLVKQYYTTWNMSDIKADGKEVNFQHTVEDHGLGGGEYTINIKVQNPLDGGTIFSFANKGMNSDGWLELGTFTVNGDPAPSYPEVKSDVEPLNYTPPAPVVDGENGMYQAENGTLEGIATLTDIEKAVGGKVVGWIGTGAEGTGSVTMDKVQIEEAGFYNVEVGYVLGEAQRFGTFDVNGGAENGGVTRTYKFTNTGGWDVVGSRNLVLFLNEGTNTFKYYNPDGWAASIDCLTFTKGSLNGINNIDGDLSDWAATEEAAYEDEFQVVKINKDEDYLYFAIDAIGGIDNCPDWTLKLDTAGSGVNYEIKADGAYNVVDGTKVAEVGVDNRLLVAQNGNVIEIMVRRDVLETETATLGYELGYAVEFAKGGNAVNTTNGGELLVYELKKDAKRVDVTKRFEGSDLRDWSNTNCVYSDELQNAWVTNDDEYLYFAVDYDETAVSFDDWSVELNIDSNYTTGYIMDWIWYWETTGNDFKITKDGLYKYTEGANTELVSSDAVESVYSAADGKLQVKVKKSALDMGTRKTFSYGIIFKNEGDKWNKALATNQGARMSMFKLDSNQ